MRGILKEFVMSAAHFLSSSAFRPNAAQDGQKNGFFLWPEHLIRFWRAYETRQHLAELDEHMLRDIGITPADARHEIMRKPWDVQGC